MLEVSDRVVVCLNLMDEARRKGIVVDPQALAAELGVPVVPTTARTGRGIEELIRSSAELCRGTTPRRSRSVAAKGATVVAIVALIAKTIPHH